MGSEGGWEEGVGVVREGGGSGSEVREGGGSERGSEVGREDGVGVK